MEKNATSAARTTERCTASRKGQKGKGKGKNYTWTNGGGWNDQGGERTVKGKGKEQENKGKGKGGVNVSGTRYWCGEWAHSQNRCKQKNEYMDALRKKGAGKGTSGGGAAWSVEETTGEEQTRARGSGEDPAANVVSD